MKRCLLLGGTGYIGSRLFLYLRERGLEVDTLDLEHFGNLVSPRNLRVDFRYATPSLLERYAVVVLLAGHSSVGMATGPFSACFENNVVNFDRLMQNLQQGQKLIYASSASVYGSREGAVTEEDNGYAPCHAYDVSKHMIDVMAPRYGIEYYGLRLGTVCGASPLLRDDLVVNAMFLSARHERCVRIFNARARRSIAGLSDLCRAIERVAVDDRDRRGIYNVASFASSVGEIGADVAAAMSVPTVSIPDDGTSAAATPYCFEIDTTKFEREFEFTFNDSLHDILADLDARPPGVISHRREHLDYAPDH